MSTVLYLPTSTKAETETPLQEPEARETGNRGSDTARIAHDLKNCMSVLLLAITSQRQYGSGTYLTASQASVGRCSRGDDSSGRRDDSGRRRREINNRGCKRPPSLEDPFLANRRKARNFTTFNLQELLTIGNEERPLSTKVHTRV